MARIKIPYLVSKKAKNGRVSWYWQPAAALKDAGWQPLALGHDEGAAIAAARARNAELDRWRATGAPPAASQIAPKPTKGTLGELIALYRRKVINGTRPNGQPCVAESTARIYETSLARLDAWAGKHPLAYITPKRVKALRDAMLQTIGHDPAHKTLKQGRQLFAFAIAEDLVEQGRNPFEKFGLAAPDPRAVVASRAARAALQAAAHQLGKPSMALAIQLGFAIGQREADIIGLTQRHYVPIPEHAVQPEDWRALCDSAPDGVPRGLRVRQRKTGAWIEIPVVGEVRAAIEANLARARAAGSMAIILRDGVEPLEPYKGQAGQTRFQRHFDAIRAHASRQAEAAGDAELAAELLTIQFRDFRRTCVVYLGELGFDAHLIAAITGHDIDETQAILKTYMPRTTGRAAHVVVLAAAREKKEAARKEAEG